MIKVLQLPKPIVMISVGVVFRMALMMVFFVIGSLKAEAQRPISAADFFKLGNADFSTPASVGSAETPRMPWFEEYQFRTETRDFDLEQQEYTFRLAPSTGRKRRALTSLYKHQESAPDFDGRESQCDALAERYADWLDLFLISEEQAILTRLKVVLKDRNIVLNRQVSSLDFDWSELVQLREATTDLDIRTSRLNTKQAQVVSNLELINPTFSFNNFITIEEIGAGFPGSFNLANDPKLDYELETVARELEVEVAESKQYFDFAQVRYRGPHTDLPRERLSVGLAFQLPNGGDKKLKIRELELEELALRRELTVTATSDQAEYERSVAVWEADFQHFSFMVETYREERENMLRIGDQLKKRQGFDPLPLLEIEERSLRNELRLLVMKAELYQDYLNIRERAGELCTASLGELLTD